MIGLFFLAGASTIGVSPGDEPPIPPEVIQISGFASPPKSATVPPSSPAAPALPTDPGEAEALAMVLRTLLVKNLPDPVTKSSHNWGRQKAVTVTRHHLDGLRVWSESAQEMRNDGTWRRTDIRIPERDELTLAVTELTHPEPGRMQATVRVAAERVDLHFEQQVWKTGMRLYAGETRGHCRGSLELKAEFATKTEFKPGSFFPQIGLILRVTSAKVSYERLLVDHAVGLNGEAAKAIGDMVIQIVKVVKPHIEDELLQKADAAIVKAAASKELTLTLGKLMAIKSKKDPAKKSTEPMKK